MGTELERYDIAGFEMKEVVTSQRMWQPIEAVKGKAMDFSPRASRREHSPANIFGLASNFWPTKL